MYIRGSAFWCYFCLTANRPILPVFDENQLGGDISTSNRGILVKFGMVLGFIPAMCLLIFLKVRRHSRMNA